MCEDYRVNPEDRFRRLPKYCEASIGRCIKTMPSFYAKDWEALKKSLCKEYKNLDPEQQIYTEAFLSALKDKVRTEKDDLRPYCQQFATVSTVLRQRQQIMEY